MKTAAAYIRVSTEDQAEYSPDAQMREILRWADREGYVIPERFIFVDDGVSGKNTAKRGAFNRMIAAARTKPKPFDAVLLWKYSRFARNREDSVVYKSMLRRELGIDVVSVSEPMGDDKMNILFEAMIEAMDEYYSLNLAEEVLRGMSEKARRGEPQCSPPYGYRIGKNILQTVPEEAEAVRRLYRGYGQGMGYRELARELNSAGYRTHRGNRFDARGVEYILRNPVYKGVLRWNPTGHTGRGEAPREAIQAIGTHEALVTEAEWSCVQQRIQREKAQFQSPGRVWGSPKDPLTGLVRCAACGGVLIFVKPHYFRCSNNIRGRCEYTQHISVGRLHRAVEERLQADFDAAEALSWRFAERVQGAEQSERERLLRSRDAIQRRLGRARELFLSGCDDLTVYQEEQQRLRCELQRTDEALNRLTGEAPVPDAEGLTAKIERELLGPTLESGEIAAVNRALRSVLACCEFDRDRGLLRLIYR